MRGVVKTVEICFCGENAGPFNRIRNIMSEEKIFLGARLWQFISGDELISNVERGEIYDIVFLETCEECIAWGSRIKKLLSQCFLIFVSDGNGYAVSSYDYRAFYYLLTDDSRDRYLSALLSLHKAYTERHRRYIIECRQGSVCVELSEIYYVEYIDKHTLFHTVDGEYTVRQTIGRVAEALTGLGFLQVHQGFAVNLSKIRQITKTEVILTDGTSVMLSQRRRRYVIEKFRQYVKNTGM